MFCVSLEAGLINASDLDSLSLAQDDVAVRSQLVRGIKNKGGLWHHTVCSNPGTATF